MTGFIAESALLTHGIASVDNRMIMDAWEDGWKIAWMDAGRLNIGAADEFCRFRDRAAGYRRINFFNYDKAEAEKWSGPLTASGTLRACEEAGAVLAVSCGIGGLRTGQPVTDCNDIMAMKESRVSLMATAFKDMFDSYYSINAAIREGISVKRGTEYWHSGYLFSEVIDPDNKLNESGHVLNEPIFGMNEPDNKLKDSVLGMSESVSGVSANGAGRNQSDKRLNEPECGLSKPVREMTGPESENTLNEPDIPEMIKHLRERTLILCPVPARELVNDRHILEEAVKYGKEQASLGKAFHPAVNRKIDELTDGYSSVLQLRSLAANMQMAEIMLNGIVFAGCKDNGE